MTRDALTADKPRQNNITYSTVTPPEKSGIIITKYELGNVSKMIRKWTSKTVPKNDAEIASENYAKLYQQILQNGTRNDVHGGPKSSPGAPEGTPPAPGPPRNLAWTHRDFILAVPQLH